MITKLRMMPSTVLQRSQQHLTKSLRSSSIKSPSPPPQRTIHPLLRLSRHFSSNSTTTTDNVHSHCVDLVRTRDRDGYLCGLLLPTHHARRSYFAIRAFNVEVASIKDTAKRRTSIDDGVNISTKMRMAWWRDTLDDIYSSSSSSSSSPSSNHPIVAALTHAIQSHDITRRFLETILDARDSDLERRRPSTLVELLNYGDDTMASLHYLTLECLDVRDDDAADRAVRHVGLAQSVCTALRGAPFVVGRGESPIPEELVGRYGIPEAVLLDPLGYGGGARATEGREALRLAVVELANVAREQLSEARGLQYDVRKEGRVALLPAVAQVLYLEELERCDFNMFDLRLHENKGRRHLRLTLHMARSWLTGVF